MDTRFHWLLRLALTPALLAGTVHAASLRPFVSGGFQRVSWEKTERNALMDWVTLRDGANAWEAGAGFALALPSLAEGTASRSALSFLLRVGLGGGNLPKYSIVNGSRFDGRRAVTYSSTETYTHSWWSVTPALMIRLFRRGDVYVGPSLQSVKFKAKRTWEGPSGFSESGAGQDAKTFRYGLLELGARAYPAAWPLFIEGSWAPFRATLSTSHQFMSSNWKTASFSSFTHSLSLHVGYEF